MTDPIKERRLALVLSATLLVGLACTCGTPLDRLRSGTAGDLIGGGVGGRAWFDTDRNGLQDEGEPGLKGVQVRLLDEAGKQVDAAVTDADGSYEFAGHEAGTYVIWFTAPDTLEFTLNGVGSDETVDSDAIVTSGQTDSFGYDGLSSVTRDAGMVNVDTTPTRAPATPTSEVMPTEPVAMPQAHITYEHTSPGNFSEIVIDIILMQEGQEISGTVTGPAVAGDGTFTAVGDAQGMDQCRVVIFQFGLYDVDIPDLGISQPVNVVAATPTPF
jgi:hypothetical protein